MIQLENDSYKTLTAVILHGIICGKLPYEFVERLEEVYVYTLFAFDENNDIAERESFYLSIYECSEERDAEARTWRSAKEQMGYRVIQVNDLGEVTRL